MAEYMGFEGLGKSQRIGVRGAARLAEEHGYQYEMLDNGKIKIFTPDGSRTFGPNVKAGSIGNFFGYAKGGAVPMKEQMELFEDGGLMQEGGTVDPVSGNDVPVGSTQEEVRDDIPAQLSEGEFVFPADVVRYYGLEKLMQMRQEAKAGLQRMEAMGQMGNSEEATLPDDIPFDLEDLDIEDEDEYNNQLEMAEGGVVKAQAGTFVQPQGYVPQFQPSSLSEYNQQIQTQQAFQLPQYKTATVGAYVPQFLAQQPITQPPVTDTTQTSFEQLIPAAGGQQETKEYRNEAGQSIFIPFVNEQPVYPVPQGYTEYKPEAVQETTPVEETQQALATTTVTDKGRDGGAGSTQVNAISGQQLGSVTNDLGVTGSRGGNIGGLVTALGFIANPVGTIAGLAATEALKAMDIEVPSISQTIGELTNVEPTAVGDLTPAQQSARSRAEQVTGTTLSGYVGFQTGDIDPVTGGVFGNSGVAIDTNTGFAAQTPEGTTSFGNYGAALSAAKAAKASGYVGGLPSAAQFSALSPQGKANAAAHMSALADITNDPSLSNPSTVMGAIATVFGSPEVVGSPSEGLMAQAQATLTNAMMAHMQEQNMFSAMASPTEQAAAAQAMAGLSTPAQAMAEGVSVSDFSSPTEAAQAGIGYSSYGEDGQPTGAAPKGSGFSKTGTFSTGNSGGSVSGSMGGGFGSAAGIGHGGER